MGQDRCAADTSRDRATLSGFLATVGAGRDQQQRSELRLVEPMESSILGIFLGFLGP